LLFVIILILKVVAETELDHQYKAEIECRHILLLFGVLHEIIVVRHGVKLLTEEGVSSSELKNILGQSCE